MLTELEKSKPPAQQIDLPASLTQKLQIQQQIATERINMLLEGFCTSLEIGENQYVEVSQDFKTITILDTPKS